MLRSRPPSMYPPLMCSFNFLEMLMPISCRHRIFMWADYWHKTFLRSNVGDKNIYTSLLTTNWFTLTLHSWFPTSHSSLFIAHFAFHSLLHTHHFSLLTLCSSHSTAHYSLFTLRWCGLLFMSCCSRFTTKSTSHYLLLTFNASSFLTSHPSFFSRHWSLLATHSESPQQHTCLWLWYY